MKKKDYLQQLERGALIGTSVLLLNGVVSCSFDPTDTPPTESTLTKGPTGLPGERPSGFPGSVPGVIYYNSSQTPVLLGENKKSGFIMTNGYGSFTTIIPDGYTGMYITMNENETSFTRFIWKIEASGPMFPGFRWEKHQILYLTGFKMHQGGQNPYPAKTVTIKFHSTVTTPIVLHFKYTND